jgi:hypothetical protein
MMLLCGSLEQVCDKFADTNKFRIYCITYGCEHFCPRGGGKVSLSEQSAVLLRSGPEHFIASSNPCSPLKPRRAKSFRVRKHFEYSSEAKPKSSLRMEGKYDEIPSHSQNIRTQILFLFRRFGSVWKRTKGSETRPVFMYGKRHDYIFSVM